MRTKTLIFFAYSLLLSYIVRSQSVYQLFYNFNTKTDTTTYTGLLFSNPDGSGFMQVKYNDPTTGQNRLQKLRFANGFLADKNSPTSTTILVVSTISDSTSPATFTPPVLLFEENIKTGFFEPTGVCTSEANPLMEPAASFTSIFIPEKDVTRQFGASYFHPDDEFFKSYFRPKSRGSFSLKPDERGIKMHLIIAADTKDADIGYSCQKDMKKALETFDSIRKYMNIPAKNFISKVFYGPSYSLKNVKAAIAALKPATNDIVIFYYSGHGFRRNETDSFPYIKLKTLHTTTADVMANSLRIKEDVFDILRNKGARMNLIISDCCNSSIEESTKAPGPKPPGSRGDDSWDLIEVNTRELFLNKTPISVLVSAAKNGEKARCHPSYNGFFTYSFINSIKQFTTKGKSNVTWEQLLETGKAGTHKLAQLACCSDPCCDSKCASRVRCTQTSIFSVLYGR